MALDFVEIDTANAVDHITLRLCLINAIRRVCAFEPLDQHFYSSRTFSRHSIELEIENFEVKSPGPLTFRNVCLALRGTVEYTEQKHWWRETVARILVGRQGVGLLKIMKVELELVSDTYKGHARRE